MSSQDTVFTVQSLSCGDRHVKLPAENGGANWRESRYLSVPVMTTFLRQQAVLRLLWVTGTDQVLIEGATVGSNLSP